VADKPAIKQGELSVKHKKSAISTSPANMNSHEHLHASPTNAASEVERPYSKNKHHKREKRLTQIQLSSE
jgi:hypothetical protein